MKLIILIFLMISSSLCYGGTRDPESLDSVHIEYAKKTDYVVKLCGKDNKERQVCATAVIIKPTWILTAAHVVKDGKDFIVIVKDRKIPILKSIYHSEYAENIFGTNDIAICLLANDADLDFYPELYSEFDEIGKQAYICGYGLTGTFNTGAILGDGIKRAGTNYIERIDNSLLICTPGGSDFFPKTKHEFLIASGDSGGGLFINNKLAGINSCVMADDRKPNSSYSDESGHTRVSKYIEWIAENSRDE